MPNLVANLYAVDIETGGLEPGKPVIEVAFGPVFSDEVITYWNTDVTEDQCDPSALRINRCFESERTFAPGTRFLREHVIADRIAEQLSGKVLVGQNVHFDAAHLEHLLNAYGLRRSWSFRLLSVSSLAVGWLAAKSLCALGDMPSKGWSQADAATLLGIEPVKDAAAHTAYGDVQNVKAIVRKVLNSA